MSAAQQHAEDVQDAEFAATGTDGGALRALANERLAAHRHRRAGERAAEAAAVLEERQRERTARSAARAVQESVARRFGNSVSYHDFLAAEAERAIASAQAEAEVAARNARAVTEAQTRLLEELDQWREQEESPRERLIAQVQSERRHELADSLAEIAEAATQMLATPPPAPAPRFEVAPRLETAPRIELVNAPGASTPGAAVPGTTPRAAAEPRLTDLSASGVTVRLYEELGAGLPGIEQRAQQRREPVPAGTRLNALHAGAPDAHESAALDEEIEFRREPHFEPFRSETVAIPGNVIEFPRPVVAEKKQRPRRAEHPLLLEDAAGLPQLRIFEVEPERFVQAPAEAAAAAPDWQHMVLPARTEREAAIPLDAQMVFTNQPDAAPMGLRAMAALVDAGIVGGAFVAFVAVAAWLAGPSLATVPLPVAGATAAAVLLGMAVGYLLLFFTLADATPGMRYARIGLCTFGERYPTRPALRRRVIATLLATLPLGMGLLWGALDDEGLGWHDRMTRMYQRAY